VKPSQLERRVKELVEKIRETPSGNVRFDLQSFSDAENNSSLRWVMFGRSMSELKTLNSC